MAAQDMCMERTGVRTSRYTFFREWRKHRRLTLEVVAAAIGMTHGNLSKIERDLLPFDQRILYALAEALGADVASLLVRHPKDPDGIWTVWDQISPDEKPRAINLLKAYASVTTPEKVAARPVTLPSTLKKGGGTSLSTKKRTEAA